jgi:O-succinylbenzoic acid--CoA ligase
LCNSEIQNPKSEIPGGWLCIPTGGSGGALRFARHDEETLGAAVGGFCRHFGVTRINSVGVLPLHHVSGLMGWMRAAVSGGIFLPWEWKELAAGRGPALPAGEWFFSLVPTQLAWLLDQPPALDWLRRFRAVLVGGGPAWGPLLERAAETRLPLAPSYGMTETAAMVTALRPEEFAAGARSSGRPLPHVRIALDAEGTIVVAGDAVFRGYFPEWRERGAFVTGDAGKIDADGHLHVLGRRDAVIITGGEKVHPEEVEAALRAAGLFGDVAVVGVPDAVWGQRVVACFPAENSPDPAAVAAAVAGRLAGFKRPKSYLALPVWPAGAAGKVNRVELARLAAARLAPPDDPDALGISCCE